MTSVDKLWRVISSLHSVMSLSLSHVCVSGEVIGMHSILLHPVPAANPSFRPCLCMYAMYRVRVGVKMARDTYFRSAPRPFRQRRLIRASGKTFWIKSVHPSAGARQSNNCLKLILNHVCMDLEPSASRNRRAADRHSFPFCYWIHANTVSSVSRTGLKGVCFPIGHAI